MFFPVQIFLIFLECLITFSFSLPFITTLNGSKFSRLLSNLHFYSIFPSSGWHICKAYYSTVILGLLFPLSQVKKPLFSRSTVIFWSTFSNNFLKERVCRQVNLLHPYILEIFLSYSLTVWMSIKSYIENNFSSNLSRHWFIIFYHPLLVMCCMKTDTNLMFVPL